MGIPSYFLLLLVVLAGSVDGFDVMYEKEDNLLSHIDAGHELSADALNVRVDFSPYDETWATFKTAYDRQYQTGLEESLRFQIFVSNLKKMEIHNAQFSQGNTTFWMGINQFADMTTEEYWTLNGLRSMDNRTVSMGTLKCSSFMPPLNYAAPDTVDWRKKGYVTPVKDQKQCGSCWAFSTTGSLEGQHFRKTKQLVSLSEQQLVDCAGPFGPRGCNGGTEAAAYAYIYSAHGIDSEKVYPYKGRDQKCRFVKSGVAATLSGCKMVKSGSEKDLQATVSSQGPISVNIDASQDSFKAYAGGVYVSNSCRKGPADLDHAVLAVGYGTVSGNDYWIVKNSWGATWGMKGYIQMARNRNNMCGIATSPSFPTV